MIMWKQLVKIIWTQRWSNSWIFAELLIVAGALWIIADELLVEHYVYNQPLGYDIENTWRLKLGNLSRQAPEYVSEEQYDSSGAEDLLKLMEQIRLNPEVEEVCATYYSCPYSNGDSWTSIVAIGVDTATVGEQSCQIRRVTPEYFTVFRVKDKHGNAITPQLNRSEPSLVISEQLETLFFGLKEGKGQYARYSKRDDNTRIAAVSEPIRYSDYSVSDPCFFLVMTGSNFQEYVNNIYGASKAELCIRMKQHKSLDEMNRFLESMGERLIVNNLYVSSAKSFEERRSEFIKDELDQIKIKTSLISFMLINVFFGIIGTFWLRTQYRKGEIGLRMALGSDRKGIFCFMNEEGLLLLAFTVPVVLFLVTNLIVIDEIEQVRMSLSFWRLLAVTGGTYLLLAGMICLGIWFPARKAANLPPAEALHYE